MMCGGVSDAKDATEEVQSIADQVKGTLQSKEGGKEFSLFKAIKYTSQVVAGTNFFIKVQVEESEFVHLRVFRPLPGQGDPELASYQMGKTLEDPVVYFG